MIVKAHNLLCLVVIKNSKMKRLFLTSVFLLSTAISYSQDITDAMRYAQDNLHGTARFRAMGGAFGALGGDLSSINVNPAGSAVFVNNQLAITFNNASIRNQSTYFNDANTANRNAFDLNQAGAVFVYNNVQNQNTSWKKLTFAINYDNIQNFRNASFFSGINPTQSIANYFLGFANGTPLELLETVPGETVSELYAYLGTLPGGFGAQQAMLGYQGYLINPVNNTPNNVNYTTNTFGGNFYHENSWRTGGYNGKLTFNMAAQYEDWLYVGANLNTHFIDYRQTTVFFESAMGANNQGVQQTRFTNDLRSFGNGVSLNFGAIAKVSPELRVGLAYETPTWLRIVDQLSQSLVTNCQDCESNQTTFVVNPRIINEYPAFRLRTPGRWTGSLAYVFGRQGLISADFGVKDYRNTAFGPVDSYFAPINRQMSDLFAMATEVRLGAEYKIDRWSLRGGYRYEQSPYKDGLVVGDLNSLSAGLGYNFGNTRLDLAYTYWQREFDQQPFSTEFQPSGNNSGFNARSRVQSQVNTVTLSLLFEL